MKKNMNMPKSDPQSIIQAFEKLRADYQLESSKIATKQDLDAQQKNKELVEQAITYSADNIFQSLAQLQSNFGQSIENLAKDMTTEVKKLAQIKSATQVENQHVKTFQNIQIAAEALNILQQEHENTLQNLEESERKKLEILEKEISKQREIWQQQEETFRNTNKKLEIKQAKKRKSEEDEYDYKSQWQDTEDKDSYERRLRLLERKLNDESETKEKNWAEREQFLEKHQTKFEEYKKKVEEMPKLLGDAKNKAREDGIKDTSRQEENKAKLLEKEREGKFKAFELRVESLSKTVDEQKVQITQLLEKLEGASQQIQELAKTAVSSSGVAKSSSK
jgi:hypothetical protein